ncbi:MAG: hypothetical protein RR048_04170 [Oscillospiraceae bacterium]
MFNNGFGGCGCDCIWIIILIIIILCCCGGGYDNNWGCGGCGGCC